MVVVILDAVDENVELTLLPRVVIALIDTTIINATMTAYSTAVGPSSHFKNWMTFSMFIFIPTSFLSHFGKLMIFPL